MAPRDIGTIATDAFADLTAMAQAIRAGAVSSLELVERAQARADTLDPVLGTFVSRFDDQARRAAQRIDRARAAGEDLGPLAGVPIAVKDFIATREGPTTAQSLVHDPTWWASRDAKAVSRLRAAGAIVLGKTTMAEHAAGRPDPSRPFPIPRNPWDLQRWTGGSSTGTGNGIAAGLFPAGLGTDTAGSVRIPAAMCGVTGFKPTHGMVPIEGCLPASQTLDVIGPMARTARDCAALLAVMAPGIQLAASRIRTLHGVRIGVPLRLLRDPGRGIQPECLAAFEQAVADLEGAGATVVDVDLSDFDVISAATMLVMVRELFENHLPTLGARWDEYGRSIRRLALSGGLVPESAVHRARQSLARSRVEFTAKMSGFDALALPTWGSSAPLYQGNGGVPARETNFTAPWNGLGVPALAVPMGFDAAGLPLSLQLVGRPGMDLRVLDLGILYQLETDWHRRSPDPDALGVMEPVPDLDVADRPGLDTGLEEKLAPLLGGAASPSHADLLAIAGLHAALAAADRVVGGAGSGDGVAD